MSLTAMHAAAAHYDHPPQAMPDTLTTELLADVHKEEVLAFLGARPLHTVVMAGFIRDNGIVSPLNRGTFYSCRNAEGELEGVALIGHATLIEARTETAIAVCAKLAQGRASVHVIIGEQDKIERFWAYYGDAGQTPRRLARELLFEQRFPVAVRQPIESLRLARSEDLEAVMEVQAQMAFAESGVNPLERDPEGFRKRCARRIEQGRVWVWVEDGRLIFKADIIAETPEVLYVEGIHVNPDDRGRGYGSRCLSQLGRTLLAQADSICVLVNENNRVAQGFYKRAGYKLRGHYDTIYLQN